MQIRANLTNVQSRAQWNVSVHFPNTSISRDTVAMRGLATPGVRDGEELARFLNWIQMIIIFVWNQTICCWIFCTTRGLYLVLSPSTYFIQLQGGQDWTGWRWGAPCNWHCGAEVETFWSLWRGFLWRKNQSASFFQRLGEEKSPPTEHQNRWCILDPLPSVP